MESEENKEQDTTCIQASTADPNSVETLQDKNVIENIATTECSLPKCEIPEAPPLPQSNDYPGHVIDELECRLDVKKRPYPETDKSVIFIASFDDEFTNIAEIFPVSPTKAWICNSIHARFVDITRQKVLFECNVGCLKPPYYRPKGLNPTILDKPENRISNMVVKNADDISNIDFTTDPHYKPQDQVICILSLKSLEHVACVRKRKRLALTHDGVYIQLYRSNGIFIKETKMHHTGKHPIHVVYHMAENNNGDICIAVDQLACSGSVVVTDMNLVHRFTYKGESCCKFSAACFAVDSQNNIVIVNQDQGIDIIDENGKFMKRKPLDSFSQEGTPYGIAIDRNDKAWIITSINKIVGVELKQIMYNSE